GDGIAAGVLASLVRGAAFNVASASAVHGIAASQRSAEHVARELGVEDVLEGSLSNRGGLVRLDVELVTGHSGFVVWTDSYPCDLENAADIERESVRQVARKLAGSFRPVRAANVSQAARPTRSVYERYLRAEAALDDPDDPRGPDRALELLAGALEQDSEFA